MRMRTELESPTPILDGVVSFLERNDAPAEHEAGSIFVGTRADCDAGRYRVLFECWDEARRLKVYVHAPIRIPAPLRPLAAELANRINWELGASSFEVNGEDGAVRLRSSTLVYGAPGDEIVRTLFDAGLQAMELYLPAFVAVGFCGSSAADALAAVRRAERQGNTALN